MNTANATVDDGAGRQLAVVAAVVAGVFFGYGFVLRVSPGVMVEDLMRDFGVSALVLGHLSAFYFYPYAILQIPIGLWLDRVGPRWSMTAACALVATGCFVFGTSDAVTQAYFGRFLIGMGCALTWPGFLMIIHQWFPGRFAFLAGAGQLAGMVGGIAGQAPLAAAVEAHGWQQTIYGLAFVGVVLALLLGATVRNRLTPSEQRMSLRESFSVVLGQPASWLGGVFSASMAAQVLAFGGLWGVPFLETTYGFEKTVASGYVSLLFTGLAIGAMTGGWWSDWTGRRLLIMAVCSLVCSIASTIVLWLPIGSSVLLGGMLLLWGIGAGGIVLGFAAAREANPAAASGLSVGLVNTFVIGSGALFHPLIGAFLDLLWQGGELDGVRIYADVTYRSALSVLPVTASVGLCCVGLLSRMKA
ncbi:MAG: MFS transporter [Thiotrichales bacterium]|nr:MFS transporter [Thiotrichales bacterium]